MQPTATPADDISEGWLTTETASAPLLPFPVTAASETALQAICKRLSQWLADTDLSESQLRDLAHTLGSRRSHLSWRRTVLASTIEELQAELAVEKPLVIKAGSSPKLIMAFTGQGAQWYAMGRELLSTSEAFRASIMRSDNILRCSGADWSLLEELLKTEDDSRVGQSQISQPVTTAVQIAIVDLLETWGIRPSYVVGHSSGEIAAAYAAGALDHDAAIQM